MHLICSVQENRRVLRKTSGQARSWCRWEKWAATSRVSLTAMYLSTLHSHFPSKNGKTALLRLRNNQVTSTIKPSERVAARLESWQISDVRANRLSKSHFLTSLGSPPKSQLSSWGRSIRSCAGFFAHSNELKTSQKSQLCLKAQRCPDKAEITLICCTYNKSHSLRYSLCKLFWENKKSTKLINGWANRFLLLKRHLNLIFGKRHAWRAQ